MRQRSVSAVGVVVLGIVPILFGGPVWLLLLLGLGWIGLHELYGIGQALGSRPIRTGFLVLPLALIAALSTRNEGVMIGAVAGAVLLPFIPLIFDGNRQGSALDWAVESAGTLYLTLPLVSAMLLRRAPGTIDSGWLDDLAGALAIGWSSAPRGLAWSLFAIVVLWLSDTGAYLVGRAVGRTPLIPAISPKKTVEGLAGGLVVAVLAGLLANSLFGLDLPLWAALMAAALIAVAGVFGDLAESLLKRQAGVKDSGALIPGHGGILDRIDALLFGWVAALLIARAADALTL